MPDKLYYLLQSRKFWASVVAILIVLVGPSAGLTQETITKVTITVVGYILGTALEDGLTNVAAGPNLQYIRQEKRRSRKADSSLSPN
jgi:hypothetical protein